MNTKRPWRIGSSPMGIEGWGKVFLVGFMGAGKSTVARKLADSWGVEWLDTDHLIEDMADLSIPEIFEKEGEPAFRNLEKKAVKKAILMEVPVIALGGGAPLEDENWRVINAEGTTFYLQVSPREAGDRIREEERPLLEGLSEKKKLEEIKDLLAEREDRYKEADFIVPTVDRSPSEVAAEISEILEDRYGKPFHSSG